MAKAKVKRRINKKALLAIILTLYLFIMAFYYVYNMPIKTITIKGNNLLTDNEIISDANIKDYPKIFSINDKKIEKKLKSNSLVKDASVTKNILGNITITIKESPVLFYNVLTSTYIIDESNSLQEVDNNLGIPVLVNYVPSDIYKTLIKKMSLIDKNIICLISEIEYSPDIKNDITINENRFLLRMNDGNYIYIDFAHFENINLYKDMYTIIEEKGLINMDSIVSNGNTFVFTTFAALKEKESGENNELPN